MFAFFLLSLLFFLIYIPLLSLSLSLSLSHFLLSLYSSLYTSSLSLSLSLSPLSLSLSLSHMNEEMNSFFTLKHNIQFSFSQVTLLSRLISLSLSLSLLSLSLSLSLSLFKWYCHFVDFLWQFSCIILSVAFPFHLNRLFLFHQLFPHLSSWSLKIQSDAFFFFPF